ncbi:MAG TPA: alpha/beta fold hydrolase [Fimbriimonadaceae bacterium]|nr:alpha/beta fold hydrolase [Fimbriimonadaceae bacterium]
MLTTLALVMAAQRNSLPKPAETDFTIENYTFASGEKLDKLNLHAYTYGTPQKDGSGKTTNAVLIMHGTGGSGKQFQVPVFAGQLFGPGQPLDVTKFFVILPDALGHGMSSKPSDGLHAKFPHYGYDDIVKLDYRLITEHLGVNHLRLVMGTSMGGMQSWVWGETYPDFMDALMPLASLPVEIAGRNRMTRRMIVDAIKTDPEWKDGEYTTQPHGLAHALDILTLMGSSPLQMMRQAPTRVAADQVLEDGRAARLKTTDANDLLYQVSASEDYDPSAKLDQIKAPLVAINSADDFINPPELGIMEREIAKVKGGKFILLPITDKTRGHGTHTIAAIWKQYLVDLLNATGG